jgi:hypothetical protein
MAAGPHYTASARTAWRTPLPTALLLLHACLLFLLYKKCFMQENGTIIQRRDERPLFALRRKKTMKIKFVIR